MNVIQCPPRGLVTREIKRLFEPPASSMPGCSAGNRAARKGRENFSARVPYALRPSPYLRDAEPRQWGEHQDRIGALRSREHRYTLDPYADYVLTTGVGWASAI